jgi:hypothetical protein
MSHLTSGSSDAVQERTMLYENIEASCFSDESLGSSQNLPERAR